MLPATILRRLSNFIIDRITAHLLGLVFIVTAYFVSEAFFGILYAVGIIVFLGYHLICESLFQKTLGKVITKTKVVDREGNKPTFLRILGRSLARYIPFEPLSYLIGKHPMGWHDSLSKTLVVPDTYTPENVRSMNLEEIKKNNSSGNAVVIVIAVIIAFFIFIAIIGVLSSVVLASLNAARNKGYDAQMKSQMSSMRLESFVYEQNKGNYDGFCAYILQKNMMPLATPYGTVPQAYVCNDSASEWAASVRLKTEGSWCIDSSVSPARNTSEGLRSETTCAGLPSADDGY
jgi:uncharacterized RDD family membrane protein YckC